MSRLWPQKWSLRIQTGSVPCMTCSLIRRRHKRHSDMILHAGAPPHWTNTKEYPEKTNILCNIYTMLDTSKTLGRRCINVIHMFSVCCVSTKRRMSSQCWCDVGPASQTVDQHQIHIGSTSPTSMRLLTTTCFFVFKLTIFQQLIHNKKQESHLGPYSTEKK